MFVVSRVLNTLISKSPVKYRAMLVVKAPPLESMPKFHGGDPVVRRMKPEDLKPSWFTRSERRRFKKRIRKEFVGVIAVDPDEDSLVGYGWIALNQPPPTNIPAVPRGSAWVFNGLVREEYRGNGYQKLLITERVRLIRKQFNIKDIYVDVLSHNAPTRINLGKMGFEECGIYKIWILGVRRYRWLHVKWGKWTNDEHPPIT